MCSENALNRDSDAVIRLQLTISALQREASRMLQEIEELKVSRTSKQQEINSYKAALDEYQSSFRMLSARYWDLVRSLEKKSGE